MTFSFTSTPSIVARAPTFASPLLPVSVGSLSARDVCVLIEKYPDVCTPTKADMNRR